MSLLGRQTHVTSYSGLEPVSLASFAPPRVTPITAAFCPGEYAGLLILCKGRTAGDGRAQSHGVSGAT